MSDLDIFLRFSNYVISSVHQLIADGMLNADYPLNTDRLVVELPRDESHGDLACNAAMVLAKQLDMKPRDLASVLAEKLYLFDDVAAIEIAGPGFINIILKPGTWQKELIAILDADFDYGRSAFGEGQAVNVEFVSANPTGPLHAAHARGAIFGDTLANLLSFCGFKVTREYYINDAGKQVDALARSALLRYREALGETEITIPDGLYPGEYLKDVGQALIHRYQDNLKSQPEAVTLPIVRSFAIEAMLDGIKADLMDLGIQMDIFSSEQRLVEKGRVDEAVNSLQERELVYRGVLEPPKGKLPDDWEEREQLLFKSSAFGDDIDRPLQKSDGSWTYFASDVAYHLDKLQRTGGTLINIWGADHGGYVKRMTAATQALADQEDILVVKLCQLVTLLENGKPVKMSKRAGTFVTLRDVMDNVGADVMRFIMLTRRNDQTLEFDYAKVTEKSRENPVFYVQYAHARASSVLRQDSGVMNFEPNLVLLDDIHELRLIKHLALWPSLVRAAAFMHEPHRVAFYLIDLASLFHGLWNAGRDNPALRFILESDVELTRARRDLVAATAQVLKTGLRLLSVKAPDEM